MQENLTESQEQWTLGKKFSTYSRISNMWIFFFFLFSNFFLCCSDWMCVSVCLCMRTCAHNRQSVNTCMKQGFTI